MKPRLDLLDIYLSPNLAIDGLHILAVTLIDAQGTSEDEQWEFPKP